MSEEAEKIIQTIKHGSLPSLQCDIDHTTFGLQSLNENAQRLSYRQGSQKENERLKSEINFLREQLRDSKSNYEVLKKNCLVLADRCWTLTEGTMCCFCVMDAFKCPHTWNHKQN